MRNDMFVTRSVMCIKIEKKFPPIFNFFCREKNNKLLYFGQQDSVMR